MGTLTVNGYLVRSDFGDDEPRIRDLELAERLGYARPRVIRELIERLIRDGKLSDVAQSRAVRRRDDGMPTKPATEFWLTDKQALKVIAKSETEIADRILDEVIDVFVAVRRGAIGGTHLLLSDSVSEWEPMWKRELYDEFCKLYGKPKTNRPPRFMAGVQSLIYKAIAGRDCYDEMKRRIPEPKHGQNLHQLFNDRARDGFEGQLAGVLAILKTSHSPRDFWERFNFLYSNRPMQLPLGGA